MGRDPVRAPPRDVLRIRGRRRGRQLLRAGDCGDGVLVRGALRAERLGVEVIPEREVTDVRPVGAADGSDGYVVETEHPGAWVRTRPRTFRAGGVVVATSATVNRPCTM